eukprot:EC784782.1.p1 GENE.EC784782.1~~EC784782.1.p1  ORF type:complete len:102 (+),score=6.11 EC784782.1:62-367(+)
MVARKYADNSRMIRILSQMSERCLELLCLPDDQEPRFLLDIGCGSGLSGSGLTEEGHVWVGLDISPFMLKVALEREMEGASVPARTGQRDDLPPWLIRRRQ